MLENRQSSDRLIEAGSISAEPATAWTENFPPDREDSENVELQLENLRVEPEDNSMLLAEPYQFSGMLVVGSQRQIDCRLVNDVKPKEVGQVRESAAASVPG